MNKIIRYQHHGVYVFVDKKLKGKHREHCLCFKCANFNLSNREESCPIANLVYALDVALGLTTPVWECPNFEKQIK